MATFNTKLKEGVTVVINPSQYKVVDGEVFQSNDHGDTYHPYTSPTVIDCDGNIHMLYVE